MAQLALGYSRPHAIERMERGKKIMDYRREGAARKAATVLRLFVEIDQDREWKLAA